MASCGALHAVYVTTGPDVSGAWRFPSPAGRYSWPARRALRRLQTTSHPPNREPSSTADQATFVRIVGSCSWEFPPDRRLDGPDLASRIESLQSECRDPSPTFVLLFRRWFRSCRGNLAASCDPTCCRP